MEILLSWLERNGWIMQVFLVVLATVVVNFILRRVLKQLLAKASRTRILWDDAVIQAATRPILLLSWVIGLSLAVGIIQAVSANELFQLAPLARRIAIILILALFLVQFIRNAEKSAIQQKSLRAVDADATTIRMIGKLLRLAVAITTTLVILQTLGISVSGVVAFGGIGGIVVGFAARDLLANFFGGLMIYLDRPFAVGDWIRSPDREIEGTVEDVGWRLTLIRTFDKRPLYVPNSLFTTIALENPSRMSNRRIFETFGLRYCDARKVREIIAAVRKMLQEHEEIDASQTLIVNFNSLAPSSLDFFIYTFTKTTEWVYFHEVKQDVLLKVIDIIHAHGADIAFPTTTVDGLDLQGLEKAGRKQS